MFTSTVATSRGVSVDARQAGALTAVFLLMIGIPVSVVVIPAAVIWALLLRAILRSGALAPDRPAVTVSTTR